jgi:hypothetical protein
MNIFKVKLNPYFHKFYKKLCVANLFFLEKNFLPNFLIFLLLSITSFFFYNGYFSVYDKDLLWASLFFADDTYYYLEIAKNIIEGYGSSFSGLENTNGYQPLWQYILVCLAYFYPEDILAASLRTVFIIFIFNTFFIFKLSLKISKNVLISFLISIYFLLNILIFKSTMLIMENAIGISLWLVFYYYYYDKDSLILHSFKKLFFLGLLFLFISLTRIEFSVIIFFLYVIDIFITKDPLNKKYFIVFGIPFVGFVLYCLLQYIYFNFYFPISGYVKHQRYSLEFIQRHGFLLSFKKAIFDYLFTYKRLIFDAPIDFYRQSIDFKGYKFFNFFIITIFISSIIIFIKKIFLKKHFLDEICFDLIFLLKIFILVIIHGIFLCLYVPPFIFGSPWYFSLEIVFFVVLFSILSKFLIKNGVLNSVMLYASFVIFISCSSFFSYKFAKYEYNDFVPKSNLGRELNLKIAKYIKNNTKVDTVIASHNAGIIAFYSDRKTVNLDGLVNNKYYFDNVIKTHSLFRNNIEKYLIQNNVKYIVDYSNCKPSECNNHEIKEKLVNFYNFKDIKTIKLEKIYFENTYDREINLAFETLPPKSLLIFFYALKLEY